MSSNCSFYDHLDVNVEGIDVDTKAANGDDYVEIVRELLNHDKVEVNIQRTDDGTTALHTACRYAGSDVVRELLRHDKVNVNAQNKEGDTALIIASHRSSDIVGILLQNKKGKVDVNAQNKNGETALFKASQEGYQKVVKMLLEHNNVDVNLRCNTGATALHIASQNGRVQVVCALLRNSNVDVNLKDNDDLTAFLVARRNERFHVLTVFRDETKALRKVNENRESLAVAMTTRKEPVELTFHYVSRYITKCKLGSGAFGDVFFAEDRDLPEPKKFAVKMIRFSQNSDNETLTSFRKELWVRIVFCALHGVLPPVEQCTLHPSPSSSNNNAQFRQTLKKFRHDNIIVLYGYNLNVDHEHQFLVYEYAANGSLDGFLKDDDKRALLPAATRLSIMFQVASAIDFLHTGKEGVKVFHRDIKSANICLTEDFTPKLIDCGLAKFAKDKHDAAPSESVVITGSTQGPALGTHGYMCPEYTWNKANHIQCDYISAFDVYSFGVVMAELILGRLNDGKPADVFQKYVLNREPGTVGGWEQLEKDADNQAGWNADALKLICKTAIGCLIRISHGRLSTDVLLVLLEHARYLQAGNSGGGPKVATDKLHAILFKEGLGLCDCDDCAETAYVKRRIAVVTCSEGHLFCSDCLERAMVKPAFRNGDRQLPCLIGGCTSLPFQSTDLSRHIKDAVHRDFFSQPLMETIASDVKEVKDIQKEMASVIDRHLPGWALQIANAEQLKLCPTVVVITPDNSKDLITRRKDLLSFLTKLGKQKYKVIFYCEHSEQPGHEPFEIWATKKWIVKVLPWVQAGLKIAAAFDATKAIAGIASAIPMPEYSKEMNALIIALENEENQGKKQRLERDALKAIGEMANKKKNLAKWNDSMVVVVGKNGRTKWVKKEFKDLVD
ncbi:serine/threonine kinase [Fragilaria crotonensis]|nr:serine/threonine kinase [Fragilaria crotonensis]